MRPCPMTAKRPPLAAAATAMALLVCSPVAGQEEDMPSDDFLEYLAALVEEEGEWVDPLELDELTDEDLDLNLASETPIDDAQHAEDKP